MARSDRRHDIDEDIAVAQHRAEVLAVMQANRRPPVARLTRRLPLLGTAAVDDVEQLRDDDRTRSGPQRPAA